jgi:predicted dienelactone hydrolase
MRRIAVLLTGLAVWFAATVTPSHAGDYIKPGPFAVGLQRFTIPDTSGDHPMATMVWYPAAGPAPDQTAVLMDAPAATTGPYPLVIVIHGLEALGSLFGPLGRHLASHGFVVAAANYDTGLAGPLDDGVRLEDRRSVWLLYDRPVNVVRVIGYVDMLSAPGGKLAGIIDTSRIGV